MYFYLIQQYNKNSQQHSDNDLMRTDLEATININDLMIFDDDELMDLFGRHHAILFDAV